MGDTETFAQSDVASAVCALLSDILALERVTLEDDFFALGGDSLAAVELTTAIELRYGLAMDPAEIFEWPNIGRFARIVAERYRADPPFPSGNAAA